MREGKNQEALPRQKGCLFVFYFLAKSCVPGVLFILLLLNGCVSPIHTPSYIKEVPPLNFRNAPWVKMRVIPDWEHLKRPGILFIAPVELKTGEPVDPALEKEISTFLRDYFYQALLKETYHDMIILSQDTLESYEDTQSRINILELFITRLSKGSGFLRYFIGFGLGQSDLQVEGRLTEKSNDKEILAFAIRHRHLGNSYQGLNPRALSGRYCLRFSVEESALNISRMIREVWNSMDKSSLSDNLYLASFER